MPAIADELSTRIKQFAVRVARFCRTLPTDITVSVVAKQLVRSGTETSANHRAARRGRSRAEFVAKLAVAAEEVDEALHWLELIDEAELISGAAALSELCWLMREAGELRAILARSVSTARVKRFDA